MKITATFISFLLIILFLRFYSYYSNLEEYTGGEEVEFEHTFLQEGRAATYYQSFRHGDIWVYTSVFPRYEYGDVVRVSGVVEEKGVGEGHTRLVLSNPEVEKLEDMHVWLSLVSDIRGRVTQVFESYLGGEEAGLLLGIVFGVRTGMSEDLNEVFRATGVLHVVAASGANIALVGGFLMALFGRIGSRVLQVVIVSAGIAFYALISGGEASILRASVMGVFAYTGAIFGRQYSGYLGLFFAVYVLLLLQPSIWRDVGFLLSVSSTFGILLFQLPIHKVFSKAWHIAFLEDFSTSFAATVGNLPILLLFFGTFPLLSLLVNVLVLWTVPFLMILGGAGAMLGVVHEVLAVPFLYLSIPLLSYFLWLVQLFPQDLFLSIENFSVWYVLGYYFILLAGIVWWRGRKVHNKNMFL